MKLEFQSIEERKDLLPEKVYEYIKAFDTKGCIRVSEIDPVFADGESLSREYDVPYEMELNCLVVEGQRGEQLKHAALVVPYGKRANMNAKVRNPLDVKKVSFADLNYVCEVTGMEYGSITPVGLPKDFMILVDESIFEQEEVIVGSGKANGKLLLPSDLFRQMDNCIIVEGLTKE